LEGFDWAYIDYMTRRFSSWGNGTGGGYHTYISSLGNGGYSGVPGANVTHGDAAIPGSYYGEIIDAIRNGFTITVTDDFSRINVNISIGKLNPVTSKEGGIYSFNPTASSFLIPTTGYFGVAGSVAQGQGGSYYEDPMFYINGGIGVASTGATIKGGYHLSNELYHYTRSSGNLHFRGGKYWNNPFVNNSKAAIAARGGAWRSAGTKLGYAGIAITTGDALMSGEFRTSQGINVAMTTLAIAIPGVGSIVAGVYFVADIGLTLSTGRGIGDRIDAATGGTHELYNGLY
jgi:hypothetical protein